MATFLVERFWPGVTPDAVTAATAALRARGVHVVETILASPDEVCIWYVDAVSAETVTTDFAAAAVSFDRLSAASRVEG